MILTVMQLFFTLNEFADTCREKLKHRHHHAISTVNVTGTVMEASIKALRLPPFTTNKLVHELNRSRIYHAAEDRDTASNDPDGLTRCRSYTVRWCCSW
jgi:hypothetical protein